MIVWLSSTVFETTWHHTLDSFLIIKPCYTEQRLEEVWAWFPQFTEWMLSKLLAVTSRRNKWHTKLKQELLGQFSSTVEQKLYYWEWRNNDAKINLKLKSKETNEIRSKVRARKRAQVITYKLYYRSYIIQVILYKFYSTSYIIQVLLNKLYYKSYIIKVIL